MNEVTRRPRLIVIPRWGGTPAHDFYPWLRGELAEDVRSIEVVELSSPPTIDSALATLVPLLRDAATDTVILGHSVGVQAALRALAAARRDQPLLALLGVAGWFTVDRPWPEIVPWIETALDDASARSAVRTIRVLLSDNDPFTSDHETTRQLFTTRLAAEVELVPGRQHFNAVCEPAVVRALRAVLSR